VKLVLDAGALVALERNDRRMWRRLNDAILAGTVVVTHGGVVGQVWRGRGPREGHLSRALATVDVRPIDDALGRMAGVLLAKAKTADVIDAALVLLAEDGDDVVTSDVDDIDWLVSVADREIDVIPV
jgi:hypothetical protein